MIQVPGTKGQGKTPQIEQPSLESILMAVGLMHQMGKFDLKEEDGNAKEPLPTRS